MMNEAIEDEFYKDDDADGVPNDSSDNINDQEVKEDVNMNFLSNNNNLVETEEIQNSSGTVRQEHFADEAFLQEAEGLYRVSEHAVLDPRGQQGEAGAGGEDHGAAGQGGDDVNMNNNDETAENQSIAVPNRGEGSSRRNISKAKKKELKQKLKEEKRNKYRNALNELRDGKWKSVNACAKFHGVASRTLHTLHSTGQEYKGSGRKLTVFSEEEEKKIATYIRHQAKYGFGLSYFELQRTIQELAEGLKASNPTRKFPEAWSQFLPDKTFVHNFARRHLLTLRSTMELNKARSIVSIEDLGLWQSDTEGALVNHPDFAECWNDPRRILNQVLTLKHEAFVSLFQEILTLLIF